MSVKKVLALVVFTISVSSKVFSQTGAELQAPDNAMYDKLGSSVSISNNWLVTGSPWHNLLTGPNVGSADIFRWNGSTWVHHQKLFAADGTGYEYFGRSVAIEGDTLVVGASSDYDQGVGSGSAYIFKRNNSGTPSNFNDDIWVQTQKLLASDGGSYDSFGMAVGISEGTIVVGAYRNGNPHDPMYTDTGNGAAYIFRLNSKGTSWIEEKKLLANDGAPGDRFGWSVAVSQNTVLIGAYLAQDTVLGKGAAYLFERSNSDWIQKQKLQPSGPAPYTQFGNSVALEADLAVIGDPFDDDRGGNFGSASVFRHSGSTWVKETELYGSDAVTNERFGGSVGVSSGRIVVGAYQQTPFWAQAGAAYVFSKTGSIWTQETKLIAADGYAYDFFGSSIAISDDRIAVGAPSHGHTIYQTGSVYVIDLSSSPSTCSSDLNTDHQVNASDLAILLSSWGNPGCSGQSPCSADVNSDGSVNATDLSKILTDWGACP